MTITEQIDKEIQGEKLFYERKSSYTKEESKLIFESVYNRMSNNSYYTSMILDYVPDLMDKVLPNLSDEDINSKKKKMFACIEIFNGMPTEAIVEESDYGHFSASVNYGLTPPVNYFKTISNNVMTATRIEEIISSDWGVYLYRSNINFLITVNLIFTRYPEFFNDEYVNNLSRILYNLDKHTILDKEKLKKYKTAEKVTLKHIKKYCKKRKEEQRALQKVKKL